LDHRIGRATLLNISLVIELPWTAASPGERDQLHWRPSRKSPAAKKRKRRPPAVMKRKRRKKKKKKKKKRMKCRL
jgi:hypothetical protein